MLRQSHHRCSAMLMRLRLPSRLSFPAACRLQQRTTLALPALRRQRHCVASAASAASAVPQQREQQKPQQQQQQQQPKHRQHHHHQQQQTLDYTGLAACVAELQERWVPSKVEDVVQPDAYTLSLRLRTPLAQGWLHLSWHPAAARATVGGPPARGAASEAFSFADAARRALRGGVLVRAALPRPWERVAALEFGPRPGDAPTATAYCEVMARYSNLVIADGAGGVVAAARQVGSKMSSLRQVQHGRPYELPPVGAGLAPRADEPEAEWRANVEGAAALYERRGGSSSSGSGGSGDGTSSSSSSSSSNVAAASAAPAQPTVLGGIVRAYQGVGPALAEELCAAAGVPPAAEPAALGDAEWRALHAAWLAWLAALENGRFTPSLSADGARFSLLGAFGDGGDSSSSGGSTSSSTNSGGGGGRRFESAHEMLEAYFAPLQASEQHAALHASLAASARAALKKARGRAFAFRKQLAAAGDEPKVRREADMIMANVYRIAPGDAALEAEDWDTGATVTLALDPLKGAVEQAEALYKRARKLKRAVDAVAPLLEAAEAEAAYLEEVESAIAQLAAYTDPADLAALREIREELAAAGAARPAPDAALAAKGAAKARRAAKRGGKDGGDAGAGGGSSGFRRYTSPGGFTILVGRNNRQNDELSLRVANPSDVWMHVRGLPGSHVVLRADAQRGAPGEADIAAAAALAAWFSKARDSGKADVTVTRAEHVRRLKGGKPGQVVLAREDRVVVARPGDSLAAREEAAGAGGWQERWRQRG